MREDPGETQAWEQAKERTTSWEQRARSRRILNEFVELQHELDRRYYRRLACDVAAIVIGTAFVVIIGLALANAVAGPVVQP